MCIRDRAFADAAEEAAAEPDNADLLEAALGRRTHDTLVLETEEDTCLLYTSRCV